MKIYKQINNFQILFYLNSSTDSSSSVLRFCIWPFPSHTDSTHVKELSFTDLSTQWHCSRNLNFKALKHHVSNIIFLYYACDLFLLLFSYGTNQFHRITLRAGTLLQCAYIHKISSVKTVYKISSNDFFMAS